MITIKKTLGLLVVLTFIFCNVWAQEVVVPLQSNPLMVQQKDVYPAGKQRATLPFIDDFSYNANVPNPALWVEQQVFINNTMANDAPTKGVATFDGLNAQGRPYRPTDFSASGFGDSLTCTPIDISTNSPADNLVLSFYVQAQGKGFPPEAGDSLYLFFRNTNNQWKEVWRRMGTFSHPFVQIFIPVNDPQYFHDSFQFRFVNFTSLNLNDDVWNIDYVKLDVGRSINDTTVNDLAFTAQPTSILNTYTALPFRHFLPTDLAAQQDVPVRNIYDVSTNFTLHHSAQEINTSTPLSSNVLAPFNMFAKSMTTVSNSSYNLGLSGAGPFVVRNTYYIDAINALDRKSNDTIITDVVFDNYFAYDDGSAEQAYFLNPALNQPAKTAMKFELRQPDSVYGVSVFFAAQVPSANGKFFSVVLYDSLGASTATDVVLKQQDLYTVQYPTNRGEFSYYAFDQPVALNAGTYYIGITQPANFNSDSIYYGLDVNTNNNIQQLSYNVNGFWYNSSVNGTVMLRPMVGRSFTPTSIGETTKHSNTTLYPNPTSQWVHIVGDEWQEYEVYAANGQLVRSGNIQSDRIDIADYQAGLYFVVLKNKEKTESHKVWKQ